MGKKKGAAGAGSIRKVTRTNKDGSKKEFWQGRVTVGVDPGSGRQIQRSVYGNTQKECLEKLQAIAVNVNEGTYTDPSELSVAGWMDVWRDEFWGGIKPMTVACYKSNIENHIKPALGATKLVALTPPMIQRFLNSLISSDHLSPKTVKNIHGILHKAFDVAVRTGYLRSNPADACELPRIEKQEIKPFDEADTRAFLDVVSGHRYEDLYIFTLFTGLREGEVLGLQWGDVDWKAGTVYVHQQLQQTKEKNAVYYFAPLKNNRPRTIKMAPSVVQLLQSHRIKQLEKQLAAGQLWNNDNDLVFTDDLGGLLPAYKVYRDFKKLAAAIDRPDARFHDLRHSYACAALRCGDDIKTVQCALGHATAAFTLDVYGHVTDSMRAASAERMEKYIRDDIDRDLVHSKATNL